MCPAHLRAAQYVLRVNGYGEEFTSRYNKGVVQRTTVTYDPKSLLFDSYLDTTYSAQIFDYDPKLLQNMWINAKINMKMKLFISIEISLLQYQRQKYYIKT